MLTIHDLAFSRNNSYLLRNINFTLAQGEILQICGANGSGKSTLLRILAGYIEPMQGGVQWDNLSIYQQHDTYQQQLQYLGHQNGLKLCLTVFENMQLGCMLLNADTTQIESAIKKVGLNNKTNTQSRFLSAGQLRRLALARLLIKPAKLWILDEPATALDQQGQQLLSQLIMQHLANQGSVILATHQQLNFADNVRTLWLGEKNGLNFFLDPADKPRDDCTESSSTLLYSSYNSASENGTCHLQSSRNTASQTGTDFQQSSRNSASENGTCHPQSSRNTASQTGADFQQSSRGLSAGSRIISTFISLLSYEVKTSFRQPFSWLTPLLFFVIAICLFPLALGPEDLLLKRIAPGIIWVSALLAAIIAVNDIFREDLEQGNLDLYLLSSYPLTLIVLSKIIAHWFTHCLPLLLITPLLGLLLQLDTYETYILFFTLCLGTPLLISLGALGAALIVGVRGHGLLLPVLIVPFYIPVLIFGTSTINAASLGQPISGYLAIMGALFLFSTAIAPLLTGISLRMGMNQ